MLNVLIANVRSIKGKIDELCVVSSNNSVDVVCITETWLNPSIPDSIISLPNFLLHRKDRVQSTGGGVCVFVKSHIKGRRIYEFENLEVESLWISIRPSRLPRSISVILLAVIYHSTSSTADANFELYNHIQTNVDNFLSDHPDALVVICGDFNPNSTGFSAIRVKQLTGLHQLIKFATRESSVLDWCLVNKKDLGLQPVKLPPIGTSDHNAVLIKGQLNNLHKVSNDRVWKRDLRASNLRSFGQWITLFDWSEVLQILDCNQKYIKFNEIMSGMIMHFFPSKPTIIRNCDKPWLTPFLKF